LVQLLTWLIQKARLGARVGWGNGDAEGAPARGGKDADLRHTNRLRRLGERRQLSERGPGQKTDFSAFQVSQNASR